MGPPFPTTTQAPTPPPFPTTTQAPTPPPFPTTTQAPTTTEIETTTEEAQTETTSSSADCSDLTQYIGSWYGGWNGKFNIPIMTNVQDWTIEIVFDKTVDKFEQWSVNSSPSGNSDKYTLTGIDGYNNDLNAGSTLSFDFLYRYQGHEDLPKITAIKLNGKNVCGNGNGNGNGSGNGNGNGNGGATFEPVTTIATSTEEPGEPIT